MEKNLETFFPSFIMRFSHTFSPWQNQLLHCLLVRKNREAIEDNWVNPYSIIALGPEALGLFRSEYGKCQKENLYIIRLFKHMLEYILRCEYSMFDSFRIVLICIESGF